MWHYAERPCKGRSFFCPLAGAPFPAEAKRLNVPQ